MAQAELLLKASAWPPTAKPKREAVCEEAAPAAPAETAAEEVFEASLNKSLFKSLFKFQDVEPEPEVPPQPLQVLRP